MNPGAEENCEVSQVVVSPLGFEEKLSLLD